MKRAKLIGTCDSRCVLPPASSSRTRKRPFSVSRLASAEPADPAPTMMKSTVRWSIAASPPDRFPHDLRQRHHRRRRLSRAELAKQLRKDLRQRKTFVVARNDVLTDLAITDQAAGIGHEHPRLARNVRSLIPGVPCQRQQRAG